MRAPSGAARGVCIVLCFNALCFTLSVSKLLTIFASYMNVL